jgi:hypothetical protein
MSKTFRNLLEVPIFWLTLVISHNTGFVDYKQLDFSDMHCKTEQSVVPVGYVADANIDRVGSVAVKIYSSYLYRV